MQLKLENLESRVERIDSENGTEVVKSSGDIYPKVHANNLFIDVGKEQQMYAEKENINSNKIGKIVKKERDCSKSTKLNRSSKRKTRIQTFATHHSRQSRNSLISEDT